jgi:predicted outer membrane repeat protein
MRYICTSIVAMLVLAGTSFAATINVPGDYGTIQGAINASSHGDVIAIEAGTYYESNLNPNGKAITIGSASGNLDVTIDANGGGWVFRFDSMETSGTVIKDLVITGGSSGQGGGINCDWSSSPTITNCTIWGNTASSGGGIYCSWYCNPTISGCMILGNTASYGGGIFCNDNSNSIISDCTISGNTGEYGGGGIYCNYDSNPTISGSTIEGNTTQYSGGGIFCENGTPTISGSQICGNEPEQLNGTWNSGGGNDIATNCPVALPPTGACCVSSGCVANSNDDCMALGGTWLGEGGSCDDCPASCMGDTDGNGVVNIEDLLNMLGSWGACP